MLAKNTTRKISKSAKSNQHPADKRKECKKSVVSVSNIDIPNISSKTPEPVEIRKFEIGVQVDELEIIANTNSANETGDEPEIRLPSENVIKEIEEDRQQKRELQLKEKLCETRQFEKYAAKEEIHLTNLKEFLDTGAIRRKRDESTDETVQEIGKPVSGKTRNALDAYDRIKRKEEELIKLFNGT